MQMAGEQPHRQLADIAELTGWLAPPLLLALRQVATRLEVMPYVVGGTVRDWLLGRVPHDLDLTIVNGATRFCRALLAELGEGALVELGTEREEAARVVWRGFDIDVSAYRGGSRTLVEDLMLRDFTVNALAVPLLGGAGGEGGGGLIDPLNGRSDLAAGCLRHCPRAFEDDPLRLVRTYRFMATLGFAIDSATERAVAECAETVTSVAAERITHELEYIMVSSAAAEALSQMHLSGLLRPLLPELYAGQGVRQPAFHHLDVFDHSLQTLREMERVLAHPEEFFGPLSQEMCDALAAPRTVPRLKWAALLHDVAKPTVRGESIHEPGRVTFHNHDQLGGKVVEDIGRRLRWSNDDREQIARLVVMHMHPFHLCNVRREQELTVRAALKLCRRAAELLPALFLLAMADSLAGQGEQKPLEMEAELSQLYREVLALERERIRPVLSGPPLLGGRDLIEQLQLVPGPLFSVILDEVQALQAEGVLTDRNEAMAWVKGFLARRAGAENGASPS